MLRYARYYVKKLNWSVIPLKARDKRPAISWSEFQEKLPTDAQLESWFGEASRVNIGIVTGKISGNLVVVDLDTPEAIKLPEERGFPATARVSTGKGVHLYYTSQAEVRNFQARDDLAGVDLRGEGGYVVAPPSIHPSGKQYEWVVKPLSTGEGIWPLPLLPEMIVQKAGFEQEHKKSLSDLYGGVPPGERNNTLARLAGSWVREEETIEACLDLAHGWNAQNDTPLPAKEVETTVKSIWQLHVKKNKQQKNETCKGERPSRIILTPLCELLKEPEEEIDYVVDDLLPAGGFSICSAKPKVGKSTLARCLALNVAQGEPCLGRLTHQGLVIYLALEEKRAEVKKHFRDMGAVGDEEIYIYAERVPVDGLKQLKVIAEEKKPILIIIDPLFRFTRIKDGNDYAMVTRELEPILALARESGAHVLCVHHMSKGDRGGGDGILGSTAIFGSVDTAICMKRTEEFRTIYTIQRYGKDMEETILTFDSDTRIISLGKEKRLEEQLRVKEDIISFLTDKPEGGSERDICDNVEGRTQLLKKSLRNLVASGSVKRAGKGCKNDPFIYRTITGFEKDSPYTGTRKPVFEEKPSSTDQNTGSLVPNLLREPENQYCKNGLKAPSNGGKYWFPHGSENPPKGLLPGTSISELWEPENKKFGKYENCRECPACDKSKMICCSLAYFEGKSGKSKPCEVAWKDCRYRKGVVID